MGLWDVVLIALGFQPYVTHFSLCLGEVALYSDAQIGGRLIS